MKRVSLLCLSILLSIGSYAQTKGTITFGANIMSSSVNMGDESPVYEQNIQSRIGYFASDHVAMGLHMENSLNDNKTTPNSLAFFTRMYSGQPQQVLKFYVEGGIGLTDHQYVTQKSEMVNPTRNRTLKGAVYVSPGVNIFLGQVVALEIAPELRYIAGNNAAVRIGASAGLKFFLSEERFLKMFPHTFRKLN